MLKVFLLLVFSCLFMAGTKSQERNSKKLEKEMDELIAQQFKSTEPGIAILIAKNRRVIYEKAFGSANVELNTALQPDMVFRIGSITKQFTAIAILQLVEQGKVSLQDSIQNYIKNFPSKGYTITIEHLLTHTSGIPDYSNADTTHNPYIERHDFTAEQIIKYFNYQPLEFKPGTKYNYSNSGYVLLAYIIEKVTGTNYHTYMRENVINPAGLTNTFYATENTIVPKRVRGYTRDRGFYENAEYQTLSIAFGCGDLMSTVEDLYKWNYALLDYKLVKKETLDKAFTSYKLSNDAETGYGYGWFINEVNGRKCIHHEGQINGFIAVEQFFPEIDTYVAVITNVQSGEDTTGFSSKRFELFNKISMLAIGKELSKEIVVKDAILDRYLGTYSPGKELFTITKNNDRLVLNVPTGGHFELVPLSANKFVVRNVSPECTVEFIQDSLGNIAELISVQPGVFNWVKIEDSNNSNADESNALKIYAGKYQLLTMQGAFTTVTLENNRLMTASTTGLAKAALLPVTESKFRYSDPNYDLVYEFVKDKKGTVKKVIITQLGGVHCKKIKQ